MTGFDLPPNLTEDPESLVRRARTHFDSPQCVRAEVDLAFFVPSTMLMVKFRQPSHEFTFGVGMTFVSYPLVLTTMV
jgi:hypothetical protein